MNSTLLLILTGCAAMALLQAALGAFFPASHRPWWHALPRAARAVRAGTGSASELPTLPVYADADADTDADLIGTRHAGALTVVETVDRRQQSLPFVGRDRRLVAQVQAAETTRRNGTRG